MFEGEVIPKSFKLEYSKDCLRHQNKVNARFEWDEEKDNLNFTKHGIHFTSGKREV